MYCPFCGTENDVDYKFCKKCGKRIAEIADQFRSQESGAPRPETGEAKGSAYDPQYAPPDPQMELDALIGGKEPNLTSLGSRKLSKWMWVFVLGGLGLMATILWLAVGSPERNTGASTVPYLASTSLSKVVLGIGSTMTRSPDGMAMIYVPAGDFLMGMDLEKALQICQKYYNACRGEWYEFTAPMHTVYLDSYWIDKTEVTNGMYSKCVQAGACQPPADSSSETRNIYYGNLQYTDYPVIYVDWYRAKSYCEWAASRLPTEAQWEKAARGTDGRIYPWGNSDPTCSLVNYRNSGRTGCVGDTAAVGSYPAGASPYGALDMLGNVYEWVADWDSTTNYSNSPSNNPTGPSSGTKRVLRGGSYYDGGSTILPSYRWFAVPPPDYTVSAVGFRCAHSK